MEDLKRLLSKSRTSLFLTSAGMSADSGIPTFRDREGYWRNFPVFRDKGLLPQQLASPQSFRTQAHHSWAFYEWRRRNARENSPHEGYNIINRLINKYFDSAFVHTTNTDGYHLISGLDKTKVTEVHGSIWRIQCMQGMSCNFMYQENDDVPYCDLDYETMTATKMPYCPECGSLIRPNVLMFGDWEYVDHMHQYHNFQAFLEDTPVPDIVFLVGSSSEIPTNDYIARKLQSSGSKVVTINPDQSCTRVCPPDIFMEMGALQAFETVGDIIASV
ncbi:MAG: iron dicitrate transport regulator FecR [Denitrovibrio sp.]|nr:MAG: iron dicitrate transport regulator FecR [Denitrovibrio sp.]